MKQKITSIVIISLSVIMSIACSVSSMSGAGEATSTPDAQATIDYAIAATSTVEAGIQETLDSALEATTTAMPPSDTPEPTEEYITFTEEELEELIDQAVEEAIAATNQASAATSEVVYDDTVSQEEYDYVEAYVYGAEEAIYYAMELIDAYYYVYGDLAYETIELLMVVEDDLSTMADSVVYLAEVLVDVEDALLDGVELATETIEQLEAAALNAASNLVQTQEQVQGWVGKTQLERQDRINSIAEIKANKVPENLTDTLKEAFNFIDQIQISLADNKFSFDELSNIAQIGANLSEGFQRNGGEKFQGLSPRVSEITLQLAEGKIPQARDSIGNFEKSLGARPEGLKKPELPKPGGGNLPKPGGGGLPRPGGGNGLIPGK